MKLRLHNVLMCLFLVAIGAKSQDAAPAQTAPPPTAPAPAPQQPSATLAPPKEVASTVNTGGGFSLEPIYWFAKTYPVVRTGATNFQVDPGNLDYLSSPNRAIGARASFPVGTNGTFRASYFQAKSSGSTIAPSDLNLFGTLIMSGDVLATQYKIEMFKLSYEYLTYFWKKKSSEIRLKTLWELQRISVTNQIDEFVPNADGTFTDNPAAGSKSILYPTFGLGLEQTMSRHFRWEAHASGFGIPHHGNIGDLDADIALRAGHFEVLAGGKYLHFKTSPQAEQYNSATIYGPFFSLRYYGKKQ